MEICVNKINNSSYGVRKCKLEELVQFERGRNITANEMVMGEYPVVSAGLSYSGYHNAFNVKGPAITVSSSGANAGIVLFHNYDFWAADCSYSKRSSNIIFANYFLKYLQPVITNLQKGSAQPHVYAKDINRLNVELPNQLIQHKISNILSKYDDLIENNNKRIKLLEQMAEELYKEWFVRFRFPGYEKTCFVDGIPEGWKYVNLFEIGNVIYGFPFDSSKFCDDDSLNPVVRIRDIPGNNTFTYTSEVCDSKYIIKKNDILVGMDGIFHMCLWNGEYALLNQRVVKINSKKKDFSELLLYLSIYDQIKFWEATLCGTTVSHLGDKHLKRMKVLLPPKEVLVKTNNIFANIMNEKANLLAKNKKLIKQRDALLPRLMSGKLSVEDKEVI